ncbi:MAG TPA: hypothetical protein VGJ22_00270 [Anaerolineales bacterium]|jgi:hypothetical protein
MNSRPNSASRSYDFLWLCLALLPLLLIAFLLPLTPHDYWWYLRLGQDVLRSGSVPSVDTYSYTFAGEPVINQPWLAAILFWQLFTHGGLTLTFLARGLMIAAAYGMLWKWLRLLDAGPRLATCLTVLAGLAGSSNWSVRPQIFAYPLFMLTLLILWNWDRSRKKGLWLLPLIGLLWVNLHASFLFIFVLAGAALVFGRGDRRALLIATGATLLATQINPYGIQIWVSVADSFIHPLSRGFSAEWAPPVNEGWQMNIFFGWLLLSIPLAVWSRRRPSRLEWAWFLGLLWMSLSGQRYVIWGLFMLAAFSATLLAEWDAARLDGPVVVRAPALNYAIGILMLALSLTALPGMRPGGDLKFSPVLSEVDTPVDATAWMSHHADLSGPLWSDLVFSSYLIYALPARPVWIDTRFEVLYPASQFDRYNRIARAAPDWESLLAADDVQLLMLSPAREPALLAAAELTEHWCELYRDPYAVILGRLGSGLICGLQ